MSSKKLTGKQTANNNALRTIFTFGFVLAAIPIFIFLAFYAYSLIIVNTGIAAAGGYAILVGIAVILGVIIFKK